jgi:short subunit dehydrogenase-like uncharacterized protein
MGGIRSTRGNDTVGAMAERDLDVVVFGATSVTGRRVCAHLAQRSGQTGAGWAAAARDAGRAEQVLGEVGVSAPETIVAEIGDHDSLVHMASRARVVLNLVGPYTRYGRPVIEACVAGGAHYVDLTGEIPFVRRTIDLFDARAQEAGTKVVQVCGFEALPADLAVLLLAEAAQERFGEPLAEADVEVEISEMPWPPRASDVLSGGTLQSMVAIAEGDDQFSFTDPGCLIGHPGRAEEVRRTSPISVAPRRGSRGSVLAPMQPAAYINPAVIHRTAALRGQRPFRYREGVAIAGPPPTLPLRYAAAGGLGATQAVLSKVAVAPAGVRKRIAGTLGRALPSSGFGPAPDRLEGWTWGLRGSARTASGNSVGVELEGHGHPGYLATARMMGEAGLLLAESDATPQRGGCLTPAAALGSESVGRFEHARLRFSVVG